MCEDGGEDGGGGPVAGAGWHFEEPLFERELPNLADATVAAQYGGHVGCTIAGKVGQVALLVVEVVEVVEVVGGERMDSCAGVIVVCRKVNEGFRRATCYKRATFPWVLVQPCLEHLL